MPDEVKTDQDQDNNQDQDKKKELTTEELIEQSVQLATQKITDDFNAKFEIQKKEISGLNRVNSELQDALKEERKSKLTDQEKAQQDLEDARKETEKEKQETARLKKERLIESAIFDAGLPGEFAKRINGETEEEIKQDVKALQGFIEVEVNRQVEVEVNKRLGGKSPEGGETPKLDDLQLAFNKAKEKNDQPAMIAIRRQASRNGVEINE